MHIVKTKTELREILRELRKTNGNSQKSTGFVPTMGFLHQGHLSLIEKCRSENDITVVSIFVNPAQFNDPDDYAVYPENLREDAAKCEKAGTDVLFIPHRTEFYPEERSGDPLESSKPKTGKDLQSGMIQLSMPSLTAVLCGPGRPGHFEGVLLIVARLLNLVQPDRAYFGKKDYQQYRIIEKMVADLDIPVQIIGMPTFREDSGLAMSSRNARLSAKGKEQASLIYRGMLLARKAYEEGKTDAGLLCEIVSDVMNTGNLLEAEYIQIADPETLQPINDLRDMQEGQTWLIAVAARCEGVRLIDNMESEI